MELWRKLNKSGGNLRVINIKRDIKELIPSVEGLQDRMLHEIAEGRRVLVSSTFNKEASYCKLSYV